MYNVLVQCNLFCNFFVIYCLYRLRNLSTRENRRQIDRHRLQNSTQLNFLLLILRSLLWMVGPLNLSPFVENEPWHHSTMSAVKNIATSENRWQLEDYNVARSSVFDTVNVDTEVCKLNHLFKKTYCQGRAWKLTLARFRCELLNRDLAYRFRVVSRVCRT